MKSAEENRTRRLTGAFLAFGLMALAGASPVRGQQRDEYGDVNPGDINYQTVARISYLSGNVSFARGDDPDNWQAADQNVPMSIGDRIYADSRSRVEIQINGGDIVRVGARSDLTALNLTDDTKQFAVKSGIVSFHVRTLDENNVFEVDTPNSAVTFGQPGDYRVEVDNDGNSRVVVWRGNVVLAAGGGQVSAHRGEEIRVEGIDSPRYDVINAATRDGWDQWVDGRIARTARSGSYQYVSADVVGADDLDDAGRWQDIPEYGHVWTPTAVAADWAPYRVGHWGWQDPWGWTWISAEPWGWAPYHYGRWINSSSRWYWVPVAPTAQYVTYSPALVAFVGGGPGFAASVTIGGGGFVGWFPLGPREPLIPWWGRRGGSVNITNVTYVNKTYVTVVNQNTFASGGIVTTNIVRDRTVVSQVVAAPIMRGPLSVVPTAGAFRVAARANLPAAPRPSAAILARSVVARVAPPPAPPTYQAKMAAIKENRGAPIDPAAAAKLSVTEHGRAQAVTAIKPVTAEAGRVLLAPRSGSAAAAKVEPVAPAHGRVLATAQQPVASSPVTSLTGRGREAHAGPPPDQGKTTTVDRGRVQNENAGPPPGQGKTTTVDHGRVQNENAGPPPDQGKTTTVDQGRVQNSHAQPTPARPVITEEKRQTAGENQTPHNQDSRGRMQPTAPARKVTPQAGPPAGQGQTQTRGRDQLSTQSESSNDSQGGGHRRDRVTPVPQGGGGSSSASESSARERRGPPPTQPPPQTEQVRPNAERAQPPAPDRSHQKSDNKDKDKGKEKTPTPKS